MRESRTRLALSILKDKNKKKYFMRILLTVYEFGNVILKQFLKKKEKEKREAFN